MTELTSTETCLRFFGDDLEPDDITRVLGQQPSRSVRKAELIIGKATGKTREAGTGEWRLSANRCSPGNLNVQISEILEQLTDDLDTWKYLTKRFRADVFCGLFMEQGNEVINLAPDTLRKLVERGLEVQFDIYGQLDE